MVNPTDTADVRAPGDVLEELHCAREGHHLCPAAQGHLASEVVDAQATGILEDVLYIHTHCISILNMYLNIN